MRELVNAMKRASTLVRRPVISASDLAFLVTPDLQAGPAAEAPETSGMVCCFLLNGEGEADGLVLTDGMAAYLPSPISGDLPAGGSDFRLGEAQLAWAERELAAAATAGQDAVVFMRTYPADRCEADADRVEAWPERGILDTQLGPNRNGRQR